MIAKIRIFKQRCTQVTQNEWKTKINQPDINPFD